MKNLKGVEISIDTTEAKKLFYDIPYRNNTMPADIWNKDYRNLPGKDNHFEEKLMPWCKENGIASVIDIGSDWGKYTYWFYEELKCKVVALEIANCKASRLQNYFIAHNIPIPVLEQDIETESVEGKFDLVFASDVVEHFVDWKKSWQILCNHCYKYTSVGETEPINKCMHCGQDIDAAGATRRKKTLTYDSIKDYLSKVSSVRNLKAEQGEYWIAILGTGTKKYNSESSLLEDITNDIDSLGVQTITEEAREMLYNEMPSLSVLEEEAQSVFVEMEEENKEEELALAANLENYRRTSDIIKSIDSKGLRKEADYLKEILNRNLGASKC